MTVLKQPCNIVQDTVSVINGVMICLPVFVMICLPVFEAKSLMTYNKNDQVQESVQSNGISIRTTNFSQRENQCLLNG